MLICNYRQKRKGLRDVDFKMFAFDANTIIIHYQLSIVN